MRWGTMLVVGVLASGFVAAAAPPDEKPVGPREVPDPGRSRQDDCEAYWPDWRFDPELRRCVDKGRSGCSGRMGPGEEQCVRKNLEKLELKQVSLEVLGAVFAMLRATPGKFSGGGAWNDAVDKWGGDKHIVMGELARRLGKEKTNRKAVVAAMGKPDESARPGARLWRLASRSRHFRKETGEILVYYWRGWHDFLYFELAGDAVLRAGWWMALER